MTNYTVPHNLPVIEPAIDPIRSATGDNLWKQINALAASTNNAISAEGGRAEEAAREYTSDEVNKDRTRLGNLEVTVPKVLADAKTHADAEIAKDRVRLAQTEATDEKQTADIRETLRAALAYADAKAADISRALDTSHVALDTDGTPYYRPGSMTVRVQQDTDGTPFYEAA